jgi:molecular chaperone GrpE
MNEDDQKRYTADIPDDAVQEALESLKKKKEAEPDAPEDEETVVQVDVELPRDTEASDEPSDDQGEEAPELNREQLVAELEKAQKEAQAAKDRMLRVAADADNIRKRALKERDESIKFGQEGLLRDLLPALDNLERTLAHVPADVEDPVIKGLQEGLSMVLKQFQDSLERNALTGFSAVGEMFDPSRHEALSNKESNEVAPGTVVEEMHRGYMLHDRLLRPALVVVACPPGEACVEPNADKVEEGTEEKTEEKPADDQPEEAAGEESTERQTDEES